MWWVISVEKTGRMSYLKATCLNEKEAKNEMSKLMKNEPDFRYLIIKVQEKL